MSEVRERIKRLMESSYDYVEGLEDKIVVQRMEIERLRKALEWYAEDHNYHQSKYDYNVMMDGGEKAKKALQKEIAQRDQ